MAKRHKAKGHASSHNRSPRRAALESAKQRATELFEHGQSEEVIALLEPFAITAPDDVDLQMMLGMCYFDIDDPESALICFEQAYAAGQDPELLYPQGLAYMQLGMPATALQFFDEAAQHGAPPPDEINDLVPELRANLGETAEEIGLPPDQAIAGLREMERGVRLFDLDEFELSLDATRAAVKLLGDWSPVHNKLVYDLLFNGQAAAAIAECRQFLTRQPDDLQTAAQLIRLLAWTGDRAAAEAEWQALSTRTLINLPIDAPADALALARAAAALDDDENVRRILQPLADVPETEIGDRDPYIQTQRFLATAEANLGHRQLATARLELLGDDELCNALYEALIEGQNGLGLRQRFTYYVSMELVPEEVFDRLGDLLDLLAESDDPAAEKALRELVEGYPQLILALEMAIWDEEDIAFCFLALRYIGTPAAHAVLRRFAGSQVGNYEDRIYALLELQFSGGAQPGERFNIWRNDAWHAVPLRNVTIGLRPRPVQHSEKAMKVLVKAQSAVQAGQLEKGVNLLRQAVDLEPHAYDSLSDLAVLIAATGDIPTSTAMLERVLTFDPLYVPARVQLALNVVKQDTDAAAAYLEPLAAVTYFEPLIYALYQYALGSLAFHRFDLIAARDALTMALYFNPESEDALRGLAILDEYDDKLSDIQPGSKPPGW